MSMRRWLGVIICLLALAVGTTAACGSPESALPQGRGLGAADAANMLPGTVVNFYSIDVAQLRDDEDLAYFYDTWLPEEWRYSLSQEIGLDVSQTHWLVQTYDRLNPIVIFEGDFEMEGVRDTLSGDYDQDEYAGIEVWRGDQASVAIVDSFIVGGTTDLVDRCLDTISGNSSSLLDDADVARVLGELPTGFITNVTNLEYIVGMDVFASSWRKTGPNSVEGRRIFVFEDGDYAKDALDEIREEIESSSSAGSTITDYDVQQRGRLVDVRMEIDISGLAEPASDGATSYETDQEVLQLAAATFYSDVHAGWDDVNDDDPADYSDNVWGAVDSGETSGHYYPTAIALVAEHTLTLSTTEFDPMNPDNPRIDSAQGAATDVEISRHAIWMGLLGHYPGVYESSAGTTDRGFVSPLKGETGLYMQEIPESAMSGNDRNGVPAPGGGYCWVVGRNGMVYGAYQGDSGQWYSGFNGTYP